MVFKHVMRASHPRPNQATYVEVPSARRATLNLCQRQVGEP